MQMKASKPSIMLPSRLNLIQDSNLSDHELFFLRYLHQEKQDVTSPVGVTVVLQHLWNEYGLTFSNTCLLYGALVHSCQSYYRQSTKLPPLFSKGLTCRDQIYYAFVSQFQTTLMMAIQKDEITECHLFAIMLAIAIPHDREFEMTHTRGFMAVLRSLSTKRRNPKTAILSARRMTYLYNYTLSLVRLWNYDRGLGESECHPLLWEMHLLNEDLSIPMIVPDIRATVGLPARYWHQSGGDPCWIALVLNLSQEKATLFICFQRMYHPHSFCDNNQDAPRRVIKSLASVTQRLHEVFNLLSVQKLLRCVSSSRTELEF